MTTRISGRLRLTLAAAVALTPVAAGCLHRSPWVIALLAPVLTVLYATGKWAAWRFAWRAGGIRAMLVAVAATLPTQAAVAAVFYLVGLGAGSIVAPGPTAVVSWIDAGMALALLALVLPLAMVIIRLEGDGAARMGPRGAGGPAGGGAPPGAAGGGAGGGLEDTIAALGVTASDRFRIGKAELDFSADAEVTFQDGGMAFNLKTRPVAFDEALHRPAFDPEGADNPEPRRISPSFWTTTFHFYDDHDTPRRVIRYPQHQPATFDFHFFEKGFAFGLRFFGDIDLRADRIELRGLLRHDYESDAQGTPVHVVRHFPPGDVVLRPHTYASLEEAMAGPPERVRRLILGHWDGRWRDELLRFQNLELLSLQHVSYKPASDATPLPDAFCNLAHLRELFIRGAGFAHLPERFGDLARLEVLALQYGALEDLPGSLAQLARLRDLRLEGNRLETLPELVGHLPSLSLLRIDGNPFVALPASLARIEKVEVEKKSEALFRDIRYRPDVDVAVDRERFMARGSPRHAALLADALARHGLGDHQAALMRHARQTLRLRTTDPEDHAVLGSTRIGGAPDLPPDIPYPTTDGRHWIFYAQIDLEDLAPLQAWLPRTGRLYFFGEGQEHGDGARVLYSPAPASALCTYAWPEGTVFVDHGPGPHDGYKVSVDATVSVPSLYGAADRFTGDDATLLEIEDDDDLQQAYWALQAELTGGGDRQHGAHLMNTHVFTQGEDPQEQASRTAGGLPAEWINLLMLDSDGKPGFCFWDSGTMTFTIHEKDLALGDFSRVLWSLESS